MLIQACEHQAIAKHR